MSKNSSTDGAYEAAEGYAFDVYGAVESVEDVDGSMVEIERAYPDAPRRQSTLSPGERGNLVALSGDVTPDAG